MIARAVAWLFDRWFAWASGETDVHPFVLLCVLLVIIAVAVLLGLGASGVL